MNTDPMIRYHALTTAAEIPADYCAQLNELAREFSAQGRLSMAETCRRRAAAYQYEIVAVQDIAPVDGEPVQYVFLSR